MPVHELKIWPEFFGAVVEGKKPFELRKNDRPYAVGDVLNMKEWDPTIPGFTGQSVTVTVCYVFKGGRCGLPDELCVLGIKPPAAANLLLESKRNLTQKLARLVNRIDRARMTAHTNGFQAMAHELNCILNDPEVRRD